MPRPSAGAAMNSRVHTRLLHDECLFYFPAMDTSAELLASALQQRSGRPISARSTGCDFADGGINNVGTKRK